MTPPKLPKHVAIIMDGNGRWAKKRFLPRIAGHKAGANAVRKVIETAIHRQIKVLTLFAFSSENWSRSEEEVSSLMNLFLLTLEKEIEKLNEQNIRIQFIGDRSRFSPKLFQRIEISEQLTLNNSGLRLVIAASYGGRWDITQAVQKLLLDFQAKKKSFPEKISFEDLNSKLATAGLPDPDLLIRTSGEQRVSNFLLWQLAYAELYFTDVLWPDFNEIEFNRALEFFASRERRFGSISEKNQLSEKG